LSAQNTCGTGNNLGSRSFGFYYEIGFFTSSLATLAFRFGPDFGLGGVVTIDGNVVA